eukprot:6848014-Lingulodinium_polyedra.AAC.1
MQAPRTGLSARPLEQLRGLTEERTRQRVVIADARDGRDCRDGESFFPPSCQTRARGYRSRAA